MKKKTKILEEIICPHCNGRFIIEGMEGDPTCPYCGKIIRKWGGEVWILDQIDGWVDFWDE